MPSNKTSDVSNFQKAILRCDCTSGQFGCSVTRFVEISPLRQQKLSLWQFLEFSLWQSFEPTLANFYAIGQFFIIVNSQILKNDLAIWSHWLQTFIIFLLQKISTHLCPVGLGPSLKTWPRCDPQFRQMTSVRISSGLFTIKSRFPPTVK